MVIALVVIAYAVASLIDDDFYLWIPGKRRSLEVHLHGIAAWLAAFAAFSAAASLLSAVVDHYDRRDNESRYKRFWTWSLWVAVGALVAAVIVNPFLARSAG